MRVNPLMPLFLVSLSQLPSGSHSQSPCTSCGEPCLTAAGRTGMCATDLQTCVDASKPPDCSVDNEKFLDDGTSTTSTTEEAISSSSWTMTYLWEYFYYGSSASEPRSSTSTRTPTFSSSTMYDGFYYDYSYTESTTTSTSTTTTTTSSSSSSSISGGGGGTPMQIVDFCLSSPQQTCRRICDPPSCPLMKARQCAMRASDCCEYKCYSEDIAPGEFTTKPEPVKTTTKMVNDDVQYCSDVYCLKTSCEDIYDKHPLAIFPDNCQACETCIRTQFCSFWACSANTPYPYIK